MNAEQSSAEDREMDIIFGIAHQHIEQGLNVQWICGTHLYCTDDPGDDEDQRLFLIVPRATFEQIHNNTLNDPDGVCREAVLNADVIIKIDTTVIVH